jgi:hypothetical protein
VVEVEDWEISLGCHVRRRSHYAHEKIPAVGRRSQNLNPHKVSCCGSKCKNTGGTSTPRLMARSLSDPHRPVNRNVQDQGIDSRPPLCQHPLAQHPFRVRLLACAAVVELLVETIALRTYNHVLILTSPSPCAKNFNRAFARAHCGFPYHPTPGLRFGLPASPPLQEASSRPAFALSLPLCTV